MTGNAEPNADTVPITAATGRWLELAVIGLNLCPFARPIANAGRIRYAVSRARSAADLRDDLIDELRLLVEADPAEVETTLLIHPWALQDFFAFNDFLAEADAVLEELDLAGTVQIASFHPRYQFADTDFEDIENCTNRSPYPTLHLLREASIECAVGALAEPASIYRRNIETLRRLGEAGWKRLQAQFDADRVADDAPDCESG
jgi:hypothetical protein